tara:strand:+ start:57 stop:1019 length:963 start_codon:yes stop_codon:yes gene_type:complete
MKRYYNPGTGELEYMPGFDDNSPLTATEKLMADGLKKKPLTDAELGVNQNKITGQLKALNKHGQNPLVSSQLDLFNNLPIQHKPKIKKTNFGNVTIIPEKKTYPFDTVKGIDHVTRTLKEESPDKLSPKEEANYNILNKEMKLSVLKDERGGLKKYNQYDKTSYPSDPEQRRRLKNINEIEKDLGYQSPKNNIPYKSDTRTPNRKKFDLWNEIKRDNDPQNKMQIRKMINDHVKSVGHTKLLTPDEFKYLDKKKEDVPLAVISDEAFNVIEDRPPTPEPVTEKPVAQIIKEMADERLLAEQKDWDQRYGKGGIPGLKRPE